MKSVKIDDEIFDIIYNLKLQTGKSAKDLIKDAIIFYIQYKDTIKSKDEIKEVKNTECIFGYYTIKDGKKDYTCPILEKNIVNSYSDLLKYCKLCNRRQLVLNMLKARITRKRKKKRFEDYMTIEMRKRADGQGYYPVYICKVCGDEFYSKRDALNHIRDIESTL